MENIEQQQQRQVSSSLMTNQRYSVSKNLESTESINYNKNEDDHDDSERFNQHEQGTSSRLTQL